MKAELTEAMVLAGAKEIMPLISSPRYTYGEAPDSIKKIAREWSRSILKAALDAQ